MGPHDQLIEYIKGQRNKRFEIGKHDCLTFTNGAWRSMHGRGYADDVIGEYADLGPKQFNLFMTNKFGSPCLLNAISQRLSPAGRYPKKGSLVAMKTERPYFSGYALGISLGVTSVFIGETDVVYMPTDQVEGAWR